MNLRPFHLAIPVHDLAEAKKFYGQVLQCKEGRSSAKWQDYDFYGSQLVAHYVGPGYRATDYFNPVDGDDVPVPHFGAVLTTKSGKRWRLGFKTCWTAITRCCSTSSSLSSPHGFVSKDNAGSRKPCSSRTRAAITWNSRQ